MEAERAQLGTYLTEIASNSLLSSEMEVVLSREMAAARNALTDLVARLPAKTRQALIPEAVNGTLPEWTHERVSRFRERATRRIDPIVGVLPESVVREVVELATQFEEARETLVMSNLRLVVHVAKQHRGNGMGLLDLIQEGNIGLMRAVERFDAERGNRFSTYAYWWIKQSIERYLKEKQRLIRLPSYLEDHRRRLVRVRSELSKKLGRDPRPEELSVQVGISKEKVSELLQVAHRIESVDTTSGSGGGDDWLDNMEDDSSVSPYRFVELNDISDQVEWMLKRLSPREEEIVRLRFGIGRDRGHSLEEIAGMVSISRERVRQIVIKCLEHMRRWVA